MNRKYLGAIATLGVVFLVGCAAKAPLTREQRVENLRDDARLAEQERWERTQVAKRQTYDDLRSEPAQPKPR